MHFERRIEMDKQELIAELCRLYRLKDEGKNVDDLIAELEQKLYEIIGE